MALKIQATLKRELFELCFQIEQLDSASNNPILGLRLELDLGLDCFIGIN